MVLLPRIDKLGSLEVLDWPKYAIRDNRGKSVLFQSFDDLLWISELGMNLHANGRYSIKPLRRPKEIELAALYIHFEQID